MKLLSTIRPTKNQLTVLAIIAASKDHPAKAAGEISGNANLVGARNTLMNLAAIEFTDASAKLTPTGEQLAKDQNIIDDSGQLTDEGNKLLPSSAQGTPTEVPSGDLGGADMGMPDLGAGGDLGAPDLGPPMEGFSPLFKQLILG